MIRKLVCARRWLFVVGLAAAVVTAMVILAEMAVGATTGNDNVPEVGFPPGNFAVNESDGVGVVAVAISAAPAAGAAVVVRYVTIPGTAISGEAGDYIDTTGVITFTHSSPTTQTFQVEINDDTLLNEPDETINLILWLLTPATATLGRNVAILVITDNDVTPPSQMIFVQPVIAPDAATPPAPRRP